MWDYYSISPDLSPYEMPALRQRCQRLFNLRENRRTRLKLYSNHGLPGSPVALRTNCCAAWQSTLLSFADGYVLQVAGADLANMHREKGSAKHTTKTIALYCVSPSWILAAVRLRRYGCTIGLSLRYTRPSHDDGWCCEVQRPQPPQ